MKDESEYDLSDIHGQSILNYRHPALNDQQTAEFMLRAFNRDFEVNGPSTVRIVRTTLAGWRRHKHHPDPRVRDRYAWEVRELATTFSAVVGAAKLYYRDNPKMHAKMSALLAGVARRVRLAVADMVRRGRPLGVAAGPQGREAFGRRVQPRAADVLRAERLGRRPARNCRCAAGPSRWPFRPPRRLHLLFFPVCPCESRSWRGCSSWPLRRLVQYAGRSLANWSNSSLVGSDGWAPSRVADTAPTRHA